MISMLFHWLMTNFGLVPPQMFFNTTFKMLMAALTSFSLTLLCGKLFIARLVSLKIGHKVRVSDCKTLADGYNKGTTIPSMGGVLFITTIIIASFAWMDIYNPFTFLLLFTLSVLGLIGFVDDYLKITSDTGMSARVKFFSQLLTVMFVAGYLHFESINSLINNVFHLHGFEVKGFDGNIVPHYMTHIFIPFFKHPVIIGSSVGLFVFSLFVLLGSANAVNLTDGLDGLATGCSILVALTFAIIAFISNHLNIASYLNILYIEGSGQIAIFLFALAGALLGFLWFNSYPAQVFMGDTGSLALGGVLALVAILLRREFLFALVGGVFVVETLSVILQVLSYRMYRKRIFRCAPIHHHFQIKGLHESKIVIRFWMIGLILALVGLISLKIQ